MAAPGNFRRSWWHNRDYGVFVANPFGRAALKQGTPSAVVVPRGQSLRLEFSAEIHRTRPGNFDPTTAWQDYSKRSAVTP